MRRLVRRGVLVVTALSLTVLSSGWPATAHNGVGAAFKGRAGPYTVYAYDGYTLPNNELQYRLVLLDASSGDPAEDVNVRITASKPGLAHVTTTANVYNNVVFYSLANPYPANWLVDLHLGGSLGRGAVRFHMHGYPGYASTARVTPAAVMQDGRLPVATIVVVCCAGVAVAGAAAFMWRRRRHRPHSSS